MRRSDAMVVLTLAGFLALPAVAGSGGWVTYENQSSTRMPTTLNDPATSTSDDQEKDYAWSDVDQDGDVDLIVVRKEPFTSTGKRPNVLFMNEGIADGHALDGVLVDRTADYIDGFLTPTNDRDVAFVDVDLDGWLDIITAPTLTDNQSKDLSHPRIYMNQGEVGGVWQGYVYEGPRIPQLHPTAGPRFCSVAAGDVTGDGYPDLYFGDYDSGGTQIFDFNNRLLINRGAAQPGYFDDETSLRLDDLFNYGSAGVHNLAFSSFGAASFIADMNGDGVNDVVKQSSLNAPYAVAISHNDPSNEGIFDASDYVQYDTQAPYFATVGDLNGDGRLDLVVVDDGNDKYYLNTGTSASGLTQFNVMSFGAISNGFGGNAWIEDLNNDGHRDVIVTDVDVDIPGCNRTTRLFRNLGNVPDVVMLVQGQVIPDSMLQGVHDSAVFDIDGDGWMDIVMGRCSTTEVWINVPPTGIQFTYPQGLPAFVTPGEPYAFTLQLDGIGDATPEPGSARLFVSINDGPYEEHPLSDQGGNLYTGALPSTECAGRLDFYFEASLSNNGGTLVDPPNAPDVTFSAISAEGVELVLRDEMEGDVSAWVAKADASVTSGFWEAVDPNGTIFNGSLAAPEDDATGGAENVKAFVTENGLPGGPVGSADVDGGPVTLISPVFDAAGSDAIVSYARWMFTNGDDVLAVDISNDGGDTWTSVSAHVTNSSGGGWETVLFLASDYVTPTANLQVRFVVSDSPNDSLTEAGIDNFQVEVLTCGDEPCDITGNGVMDVEDLLALLGDWGDCPGCPSDLNGDGVVSTDDLLALLAAWGPCP